MRKIGRFLCFAFLALTFVHPSFAQGIKDPTHWTYESKKISEDRYLLIFKLQLDKGWHIWAINAGGDGLQVVPKFNFEGNKKIELIDSVQESGKLISQTMEGIEGKVNYYSDKIVYIQNVKAATGTIIKGTHEYQVCNDFMCLPPTEKEFSFTLN